jgi:hypothetical protein
LRNHPEAISAASLAMPMLRIESAKNVSGQGDKKL